MITKSQLPITMSEWTRFISGKRGVINQPINLVTHKTHLSHSISGITLTARGDDFRNGEYCSVLMVVDSKRKTSIAQHSVTFIHLPIESRMEKISVSGTPLLFPWHNWSGFYADVNKMKLHTMRWWKSVGWSQGK